MLWGYKDLVKKFHEDVCPALAEAREKEDQQEMTDEHAGNHNLHLAVEIELDDDTAALHQPSPPAPLDYDSRPFVMTQTAAQPDSQGQPDDHPATLDERALLTTSVNTGGLELASGEQMPPRDIEERVTSPSEIEETLATSEDNNGASRV